MTASAVNTERFSDTNVERGKTRLSLQESRVGRIGNREVLLAVYHCRLRIQAGQNSSIWGALILLEKSDIETISLFSHNIVRMADGC